MSLMYFGMPSLFLLKVVVIFRYNEGFLFVKRSLDFYGQGALEKNCPHLTQQVGQFISAKVGQFISAL